jgi:multiple antibiotic resistance protein
VVVLNVFFAALAALVPITNPVGALAAYAGLSATMTPEDVKKQAWRTGIYVFAILAVFAAVGSLVLDGLGISLPALQIAGGLVVMHSGYGMITPQERLSQAEKDHAEAKNDVSFSPMALPLVAGPGAIGVVIALSARYSSFADRGAVVVATALIAVVVGVLLRFGTPLVDKLGPTGIGALTRIIGFLILAIGVELVVHGVLTVTKSG